MGALFWAPLCSSPTLMTIVPKKKEEEMFDCKRIAGNIKYVLWCGRLFASMKRGGTNDEAWKKSEEDEWIQLGACIQME